MRVQHNKQCVQQTMCTIHDVSLSERIVDKENVNIYVNQNPLLIVRWTDDAGEECLQLIYNQVLNK